MKTDILEATMPTAVRKNIRRQVLRYLSEQHTPVRMSSMAQELRRDNQNLSRVRDEEFRAVVQPMIVTGKLSYAPGLKIKFGRSQ